MHSSLDATQCQRLRKVLTAEEYAYTLANIRTIWHALFSGDYMPEGASQNVMSAVDDLYDGEDVSA